MVRLTKWAIPSLPSPCFICILWVWSGQTKNGCICRKTYCDFVAQGSVSQINVLVNILNDVRRIYMGTVVRNARFLRQNARQIQCRNQCFSKQSACLFIKWYPPKSRWSYFSPCSPIRNFPLNQGTRNILFRKSVTISIRRTSLNIYSPQETFPRIFI